MNMATPPSTPTSATKPPAALMPPPDLKSPKASTSGRAGDVEENGILLFPYHQEDYDIMREIGSGQFSIVYEATPKPFTPPALSFDAPIHGRIDSMLTPPTTPVKNSLDRPRKVFAVKKPVDRSSSAALRDEARILTRIRDFEGHEQYTVVFYGMDSRNDALIEDAMPCSLEGFIKNNLNKMSAPARVDAISAAFHHLTKHLVDGLVWLHSHDIIHNDIKPGNILLRPSDKSSLPHGFQYEPIYADFSSATCAIERPGTPKNREAPVAGGTWDFMYFGHIKNSRESAEVLGDGYGLTMTILFFIIGGSPYRSIPNRWLQMDARKQGKPIEFALRDPGLAERFEALSSREGFEDVRTRLQNAFNGAWKSLA